MGDSVDGGHRDDADQFEFIEASSDSSNAAESTEVAVSRRSRWVDAAVVGLLGIAAVWLLTARTPVPNDVDPSVPTSPSSATSTRAVSTTEVDLSREVGLAEWGDQRLLVVVSDRAGNESRLLSITPEATEVLDLPPLRNFVFDASGRWLAATSLSRLAGVREVLWVAPVGGAFEPVAIDVVGFAWHDEQTGQIAWTTDQRETIFSIDFENAAESEADKGLELQARGALSGWGDWGFSVRTSFRVPASALIDPSGDVVAEEIGGAYVGRWHDGRLLFSGGRSGSTFIDGATWSVESVPFVDSDDVVWTLTAAEDQTAVLIADRGVRGTPFDGSVVVSRDGATGSMVASASAYTRLAWLGDAMVFAEQDVLGEPEPLHGSSVTVVTAAGGRFDLSLPTLFDGRVWISAIAVSDTASR